MANPEHVEIVRQGAEAIAAWRRSNPGVRLDLSGADLSQAYLAHADLSGAALAQANMFQGALAQAKLSGADLPEALLAFSVLAGADLSGANLFRASLVGALAFGINLSGANLTEADLAMANLMFADFSGAKLVKAKLSGTNLVDAKLPSADLTGATLGRNCLGFTDLSRVVGLASVTHEIGSSVGAETLIESVRGAGGQLTADLRAFFRSAGVPSELLDVVAAIAAEIKYHTCFIAYGEPDKKFARRLCDALEASGVSCWLYDMDATPGERTWAEIVRKRREAEKTVVLCSTKALVRAGVLKEIEEQIDEDPDKIVPISLDDLWKASGFRVMRAERDLKPYLLERNYADFANLAYEEALKRLLRGLRRDTEQRDE